MQWTIRATDIAIILATLLGPVLAIQVQKLVEWRTQKKGRREWIFRTLMATRGARLSQDHVQALNMIDFEFDGGGQPGKVREAWNEYRDHLNTKFTVQTFELWDAKGNDLFVNVLYEMSMSVGYKFEKPHIRGSIYSPVAHGTLEREQEIIRKGLVAFFSGNFSVPVVTVPGSPEAAEDQTELLRLAKAYLSGEKPYRVEIVDSAQDNPKQLGPGNKPKRLEAAEG